MTKAEKPTPFPRVWVCPWLDVRGSRTSYSRFLHAREWRPGTVWGSSWPASLPEALYGKPWKIMIAFSLSFSAARSRFVDLAI